MKAFVSMVAETDVLPKYKHKHAISLQNWGQLVRYFLLFILQFLIVSAFILRIGERMTPEYFCCFFGQSLIPLDTRNS